ncbi:MAG: hypothetical protein GY820_44770 [Gammaproteobacteria bacterium]|nr:hypothetical protein [Gammaproteobacteria bacterium]
MQTVAKMYVTGVCMRRVEKIMQSMGIENIASTKVSRANQKMDEALNGRFNKNLSDELAWSESFLTKCCVIPINHAQCFSACYYYTSWNLWAEYQFCNLSFVISLLCAHDK